VAGPADHSRNSQTAFEEFGLFAGEWPGIGEPLAAVIAGEDDDCVVGDTLNQRCVFVSTLPFVTLKLTSVANVCAPEGTQAVVFGIYRFIGVPPGPSSGSATCLPTFTSFFSSLPGLK